jgi:hypothetical protein
MGEWRYGSTILNLGISFMIRLLCTRKRVLEPIRSEAGKSSRDGLYGIEMRTFSCPSRASNPDCEARRHTDWAMLATMTACIVNSLSPYVGYTPQQKTWLQCRNPYGVNAVPKLFFTHLVGPSKIKFRQNTSTICNCNYADNSYLKHFF